MTIERLKELLRYDEQTGYFFWKVKSPSRKKGDRAGALNNGSRRIRIDNICYSERRLIIFYMKGEWPERHVNQPLTQKRVKELLRYDEQTGYFFWKVKKSKHFNIKIGDRAGGLNRKSIRIKIDGISYSESRLAHFYQTGRWPEVNQTLTQKRLKELLSYDEKTGYFFWKVKRPHIKIGDKAGYLNNIGYIQINIDGRPYSAARLAIFYTTGQWPLVVDHIDKNRSNDVENNLRDATPSQNQWNKGKYKNNKSGFKGVCWDKRRKKWVSYIQANGKQIFLGSFDTPEEAHVAYCAAADRLHGKFARYQ